MKIITGLALLAVLGTASVPLRADGAYVLGGIGGKAVYDQDFDDYYAGSNDPYPSDWTDDYGNVLGEGTVSLGWRFPGVMAVEAMVGVDTAREASATTYLGDSTLLINPMFTVALGPVFCWDRPSWWFAESGVTELGLRAEWASISGSETVDGYGSQNFSDSAPGFGIFLRALNIWNPTGFNIGLEVGYDYEYFDDLTLSDTNGGFAGNNGKQLNNYRGGDAYIDNEGAYLRFVIGWSQPSQVVPTLPRRRGNYDDEPGGGYPDYRNYGD
jgi:hypothetical protein